jgi:hypothetical protein
LLKPAITNDQIQLLKSDNVVSTEAEKGGHTLQTLGIKPVSVDAVLPTYMVRYREHGQFSKAGKAA